MKIGIVTFHSAHNYGAVLQAWSLQEYLKQQGHQVEIVNLRLPVIDRMYRLTYRSTKRPTKSAKINRMFNASLYKMRCTKIRMKEPARYEKYHKFEQFINKKLPVTKKYGSYRGLKGADLQYDALIAGSDQIWNGTMMRNISSAYFLDFGNPDALRISYAASIGSETIPPRFEMMFKRYLRDFDSISVREKKAKAEVERLTDQPVDLVADPTFLLTASDFERLVKKPKVSGKYIYVHNVHLKRVDDALNSVAEEMSKRLNLPIVHNWDRDVYSNELKHFTGGIEEFLGYVQNAEYVITNSFHCTVFALIFRRDFITIPHYTNPDRMKNLLEELGLSNHLIDHGSRIPEDLSQLSIDFDAVEERRKRMGDHAKEFLAKSLAGEKRQDHRTYFDYPDEFRCYGCGACKDACPADAITMVRDVEGFIYPKIDEERCIHCDKCKKVCIHERESLKNLPEEAFPIVYAARSKSEEVVRDSTSGGMFPVLASGILERGGSVVGVCYDKDLRVIYDVADNPEDCEKFKGSKYVFAESEDVKKRTEQLLKEGRHVLFTGTPCQIAGLKSYLGRPYEKLYTAEIICHGSSSPKVFEKYRDFMEEVYQSKIQNFSFRNKYKGVDTPFVLMEFESGCIHLERAVKNNLSRAFRNNYIHRPSCYQCEYVGQPAGVADFTIGDYWGIKQEHPEFADPAGISLLKINTSHGLEYFETVKDQMDLQLSTYEQAYAHNYRQRMTMPCQRSRLMYFIDEKPIDDLLLTFNQSKRGGLRGL